MKWLVVLQVAVMTILQPRTDARLLSTAAVQREASPVLTRSEESLVETSMWHRPGITALIPLRTIPLQERYRQQRQTQHM